MQRLDANNLVNGFKGRTPFLILVDVKHEAGAKTVLIDVENYQPLDDKPMAICAEVTVNTDSGRTFRALSTHNTDTIPPALANDFTRLFHRMDKLTRDTEEVMANLFAAKHKAGDYTHIIDAYRHTEASNRRDFYNEVEMKALVLALMPEMDTETFTQFLSHPGFGLQNLLRDLDDYGSESPVNLVLTRLAVKHGLLSEGESARDSLALRQIMFEKEVA